MCDSAYYNHLLELHVRAFVPDARRTGWEGSAAETIFKVCAPSICVCLSTGRSCCQDIHRRQSDSVRASNPLQARAQHSAQQPTVFPCTHALVFCSPHLYTRVQAGLLLAHLPATCTVCGNMQDVRRTFPRLAMFASDDGIAALWRVLRAYALHDPVVGYCQGMNFVAGLLLLHLDEPSAFAGESYYGPRQTLDPM